MSSTWLRSHPSLVGGILLGVGTAGTLFYHRHSIAQNVQKARLRRLIDSADRRIFVVSDEKGWDDVVPLLKREASYEGAIGFDCEWVQIKGRRRPVALLQLASCSGLCVLVRLSEFGANIPDSLKELLEDETIVKVGVGCVDDSNYLAEDYSIQVRGCVDLRYLVLDSFIHEVMNVGGRRKHREETKVRMPAGGMGLSALAEMYLNKTLDKDWRVRASDWEAKFLTKRQINYAAEDALVGIHILIALMEKIWTSESYVVPLLPNSLWHQRLASAIQEKCAELLELKFTVNKKNPEKGTVKNNHVPPNKSKPYSRAYSIRRGPLYHNCQLRAPDDQPLCTIDPKKARWYVEKGLGILVSEDPLVVRLKFEPAGRPQNELEDGQFYLQKRQNLCVVCGKDQSYIRKNVIPHEYRKYFPAILKHHQSHDVVLLCIECHRLSNIRDNTLRMKLAEECEAPIGTDTDVKATIDKSKKTVRYAASALLKSSSNIPDNRITELENVIKEYYGITEITKEILEETANMDVKIYNEKYQAHGHKVFEVYEKIGLVKLEQRWRQHFLTSMNPRHLPTHWSVNHNDYKLRLKMGRLPLDHPDRTLYKVAIVGTEGTIDVPYNPHQGRRSSKEETQNKDTMPEESLSEEEYEDDSSVTESSGDACDIEEIDC